VTHFDAFAVPLRCYWGALAMSNVFSKRSLGVDYSLVLPVEPAVTVVVGKESRVRGSNPTESLRFLCLPLDDFVYTRAIYLATSHDR
jgi:hypothetical protein